MDTFSIAPYLESFFPVIFFSGFIIDNALICSVKVVFIQYRFQKSRLCTVSFFPYPIE